jgi:hypothetical protein
MLSPQAAEPAAMSSRFDDTAASQRMHKRQVWAGTDMPPRAWFLPGPICIRGGLARHLASAWLFHRGIHLEATLASLAIIITQDQ